MCNRPENQFKRGYARSKTYVCQQKVENQEEMLFKSAWKLSVVQQVKETNQIFSSIWTDYLHNLKKAQNRYMEKWLFLVLLYTKFLHLKFQGPVRQLSFLAIVLQSLKIW